MPTLHDRSQHRGERPASDRSHTTVEERIRADFAATLLRWRAKPEYRGIDYADNPPAIPMGEVWLELAQRHQRPVREIKEICREGRQP